MKKKSKVVLASIIALNFVGNTAALAATDKSETKIARLARDLNREAEDLASSARENMRYVEPSQPSGYDALSQPRQQKQTKQMTAESTRYFRLAEEKKLQAMEQFNRLEPTNSLRIEAQREMVYFYKEFNETAKADAEKRKLSQLLHTTDEDKLFPRIACGGCGRG